MLPIIACVWPSRDTSSRRSTDGYCYGGGGGGGGIGHALALLCLVLRFGYFDHRVAAGIARTAGNVNAAFLSATFRHYADRR